MSEVFLCPHCQRPAHLWGGATCDVCDRDNSGKNDRDEPVGIGPHATPQLFKAEEKGWWLSSSARHVYGIEHSKGEVAPFRLLAATKALLRHADRVQGLVV
jgi:hypothetical protein